MKESRFTVMLTSEDRYRHHHVRFKRDVLGFVVQYETRLEGKWLPVVRYDTRHGFAHRDLFRLIERSYRAGRGKIMINYRLDFAKKYLDDAIELFNNKKFNSSASRAYYASYQAMWAALGDPE